MKIITDIPRWGVNYGPGYNAFTVRRKDFVAAGIRWFEHWGWEDGAPCPSHTFIVTGPDATEEAFGDGVHSGKLSTYLNDPDVALFVRQPLGYTPEMGAAIVAEANKHDGDHYNYGLIVAMAISNSILGHGLDWITGGRFADFVDGIADKKRAEICSQLVAMCDAAQPQLRGWGVLGRPACTIKPNDLFTDDSIYALGATRLVPTLDLVQAPTLEMAVADLSL